MKVKKYAKKTWSFLKSPKTHKKFKSGVAVVSKVSNNMALGVERALWG